MGEESEIQRQSVQVCSFNVIAIAVR